MLEFILAMTCFMVGFITGKLIVDIFMNKE
jgi:hypothetical protein